MGGRLHSIDSYECKIQRGTTSHAFLCSISLHLLSNMAMISMITLYMYFAVSAIPKQTNRGYRSVTHRWDPLVTLNSNRLKPCWVYCSVILIVRGNTWPPLRRRGKTEQNIWQNRVRWAHSLVMCKKVRQVSTLTSSAAQLMVFQS